MGEFSDQPARRPIFRRPATYAFLLSFVLATGLLLYFLRQSPEQAHDKTKQGHGAAARSKAEAADLEFVPKPVELLDADTLAQALPKPPPGWRADEIRKGVPGAAPHTHPSTSAACTYHNGFKKVEVHLVDQAKNKMALLPFLMPVPEGEKGSSHQMNVKRGEDSGRFSYDKQARSGKLTVVIAKRFQLDIDSTGIKASEVLDWWKLVDSDPLQTVTP